jgi:hypothetical protein
MPVQNEIVIPRAGSEEQQDQPRLEIVELPWCPASVSGSKPASRERVKTGQSWDARTCFLSTSHRRRRARSPVIRPWCASCVDRT